MAFTKIAAAGIGSTETVTLHSLEVLNNATVGGVLTYEDVTNVDSIGIVTARAGVLVGSGITLSKDGDIFATGIVTAATFSGTFSGDGTSVTGVAATENIRTNTNATFLQNINVSGLTTTGIISAFTNTDGTTDLLTLHADADGTNNGVASIKFTGNAGNHSSYIKGGHTTNGDTILTFHTDDYASGFNPEERLRIDSSGKLLKGHTADVGQIRTQFNQDNQFVGSNNAGIRIASYSNNAYASSLEFVKSRSDTKGTNTLVQNNDVLGQIYWGAADGSQYHPAAYILASMDGATNTDDIPTKIVFGTTSDGANGANERLRITSDGHLRIGNDTGRIQLGAGQDLQLIHDGSASKIIAKPEFMLQSDEITFRSENGTSTHAIINSSGQVGIGTNIPGEAVSINGSAKFASGTSVGGPAMLIQPHDDVTLVNNASATLSFGARFTGLIFVSGKNNDTASVVYAVASASSFAADGVNRLIIQNHPAANTSDLTITSPNNGGTHQFQLNQTGTATKTYKIFGIGIKE